MSKNSELSWSWWLVVIALVFGVFIVFKIQPENVARDFPQERKELAKQIILQQYPSFETEIQQKIHSSNPNYSGTYTYDFYKTSSDNIVIVDYGVSGFSWWELVNPFRKKQTQRISYQFAIDLQSKTVSNANCESNPYVNRPFSSTSVKCGQ
jgi:hypothetical protein